MKKKQSIIALVLAAIVTVLLGWTMIKGWGPTGTGSMKNINLGLDLSGGVSITYQAVKDNPTDEEMSDTRYKLEQRAQQYSEEAQVYLQGDNRITIEIPGATGDMNNDWVMFRYSEVIYNKAEALMRKNGGKATQEVVDMINSVRQRSFKAEDWEKAKYTTATLTMDEFLAEKGREFAFEGIRRTDLVRFNKFVTTSWWDKTASNEPKRNIFPIPQRQLDANANLSPNEANSLF